MDEWSQLQSLLAFLATFSCNDEIETFPTCDLHSDRSSCKPENSKPQGTLEHISVKNSGLSGVTTVNFKSTRSLKLSFLKRQVQKKVNQRQQKTACLSWVQVVQSALAIC
ncbi:unnamed protein product [Brassica oleracea]